MYDYVTIASQAASVPLCEMVQKDSELQCFFTGYIVIDACNPQCRVNTGRHRLLSVSVTRDTPHLMRTANGRVRIKVRLSEIIVSEGLEYNSTSCNTRKLHRRTRLCRMCVYCTPRCVLVVKERVQCEPSRESQRYRVKYDTESLCDYYILSRTIKSIKR